MGQTNATNTFDETLDSTAKVHVVVLNHHKFNGDIDIKVSKSPRYTVKHLLTSTIHHLQQTHQPTTYHIHYVSFNTKKTSTSNHIQSHIYYSNETQKFNEILESELNDKDRFKLEFVTECDIEIPVHIECLFNERYNEDDLKLSISYNNTYFIRDILTEIVSHIHSKHKHHANIGYDNLSIVDHVSFCKNNEKNYPITHYKDVLEIHSTGISIQIMAKKINCPYMINGKQCPIYGKMLFYKKYNKDNYKHLCIFNHFEDDSMRNGLEECQNVDDCVAFNRIINHGNCIEDKCHLKLYKHSSFILKHMKRYDIWTQNVTHFFNNNNDKEDIVYLPVYLPTFDDEERFTLHSNDSNGDLENGYLDPLKQEVINNGFRSDLYLNDTSYPNNHHIYSIMEVVEEKLDILLDKMNINSIHYRYKLNKAEMLSIILYLNGKCMKDLSQTQMNGNYLKWKWFDRCLYDAIDKLSKCQLASYPIYCKLEPIHCIFNSLHSKILNENESVNMNQIYQNACFSTYIVGSRYKEVPISIMNHNGNQLDVLCEINKSFTSNTNKCCDISWISNYPHQYEVIMQRNTSNRDQNEYKFNCFIGQNGLQTVSMNRD